MHISKVEINGYRNCKENSKISFNNGLNVLVGENASGKTTIINALRLILKESEFSSMHISEDDFYKSFTDNNKLENIAIDVEWNDLNEDELITFLTWCDADFKAKLHLEVAHMKTARGYFKKSIWGGASKSSAFEEETFDCIDCIYLPPLRDAEEKLTSGRKSRLAILLDHQYENEEQRKSLEEKVNIFNKALATSDAEGFAQIKKTKKDINESMTKAMGNSFSQSINLQFTDSSFASILRNVKMMFFPEHGEIDDSKFREIAINSLGYNNLLYIATILSEVSAVGKENNLFTVLLIEEPEAHLHPQLQIKLMKYFQKVVSSSNNIQIIITTHSPVIASSVSIDNLIHIQKTQQGFTATQLSKSGINEKSKKYLNRWLDITKSTLLFSRGVILVEGISEAILLPELAKIILKNYNENNMILPSSLEEAGVSVININGITFSHFFELFCITDESCDGNGYTKLEFRCSGITDNDPPKKTEEDDDEISDGKNPALKLIHKINKSHNARLYSSPIKTFEYDFAMNNNTAIMAEIIGYLWLTGDIETVGSVKYKCKIISDRNENELKASIKLDSEFILSHISNSQIGKGIFAQELACRINEGKKSVSIPDYIKNAIIWACGGDVNE